MTLFGSNQCCRLQYRLNAFRVPFKLNFQFPHSDQWMSIVHTWLLFIHGFELEWSNVGTYSSVFIANSNIDNLANVHIGLFRINSKLIKEVCVFTLLHTNNTQANTVRASWMEEKIIIMKDSFNVQPFHGSISHCHMLDATRISKRLWKIIRCEEMPKRMIYCALNKLRNKKSKGFCRTLYLIFIGKYRLLNEFIWIVMKNNAGK